MHRVVNCDTERRGRGGGGRSHDVHDGHNDNNTTTTAMMMMTTTMTTIKTATATRNDDTGEILDAGNARAYSRTRARWPDSIRTKKAHLGRNRNALSSRYTEAQTRRHYSRDTHRTHTDTRGRAHNTHDLVRVHTALHRASRRGAERNGAERSGSADGGSADTRDF